MLGRRVAFTLVELLVVIGIIGLLISILLPALSRARAASQTTYCVSNLRILGLAFTMYSAEKNGYLPYPVTDLGQPPNAGSSINDEGDAWFNALDPYLQRAHPGMDRKGVAEDRTYSRIKQCIVWQDFPNSGAGAGTSEGPLAESARTYKMNTYLRHGTYTEPIPSNTGSVFAKVTDVRHPENFVLMGDGISLDSTGDIDNQRDSEDFCMGVNDRVDTFPSLRHQGGADILFVDGHAAHLVYPTTVTNISYAPKTTIRTWQSEFIISKGSLSYTKSLSEQPNVSRNPNMPLEWSAPGWLYHGAG